MKGAVVWLTGLPASGKSTLARQIAARLRDGHIAALVLDGDELRAAMVPPPGYDGAARDGFYRTLANLACLAARQGLIAIVAATAHRRAWRDAARARAPRFVEVHVATPLAECRRRDPRGVYRREDTREVPGVGVEYEPPLAAEVTSPSGDDERAADAVVALLRAGHAA